MEIEFELENIGRCTFAASKGEEFVLPNEVFVDSSKISLSRYSPSVNASVPVRLITHAKRQEMMTCLP